MGDYHPFGEYVRTLARGPARSRNLTEDEAHDAMAMILKGEAVPEQIGAYFMLLRYHRETPEELAGMTRALREHLALDGAGARPDLDWPAYASGKSRGLPLFVLSALLLATSGIRVLMHGYNAFQDHPVTAEKAFALLGLPVAKTLGEAETALADRGIAYIALDDFCPELRQIIDLRGVLGLRSCANTLARMFNPLGAEALIQGVFHPDYRDLQQGAAHILGQRALCVFKGGGGEAERNPLKPCAAFVLRDGEAVEEEWPARLDARQRHLVGADSGIEGESLRALWRGELDDAAMSETVIGTAAVALRLTGRAGSIDEAEAMAEGLWADRPRDAV